MPDTPEADETERAEQPAEEPSVRWRMAWFFAIAAIIGLAFAGAAGLFRSVFLH